MKVVSRTCFGFTLPRLGYASEERGREKRDGNPKKKLKWRRFRRYPTPTPDARDLQSFFFSFFSTKNLPLHTETSAGPLFFFPTPLSARIEHHIFL